MTLKTYTSCPAWTQATAETSGPFAGALLKWSGPFDPPAIGSDVHVRINGIGRSRVVAYAEHEGYLGVMTVAYNPPKFLQREIDRIGNDTYQREGFLSFGAELKA